MQVIFLCLGTPLIGKMGRAQIVFVLVSVTVLSLAEGAAEPDPRGFTEDPLDTEEKFRENGKN